MAQNKWQHSSVKENRIPYCRSRKIIEEKNDHRNIIQHGDWRVCSVSGNTTLETVSFSKSPSVAYVCFRQAQWCKIVYRFHCSLTSLGIVMLDDQRSWNVSRSQIEPVWTTPSSAPNNELKSQCKSIRFGMRRRVWHPPIDRGKYRSFLPFLTLTSIRQSMSDLGRVFVHESNEKLIVRVIGCVFPPPKPFDTRVYLLAPTHVVVEYLSPKDVWLNEKQLNKEWLYKTRATENHTPNKLSILASWMDDPNPNHVRLRLGRQIFVPLCD